MKAVTVNLQCAPHHNSVAITDCEGKARSGCHMSITSHDE